MGAREASPVSLNFLALLAVAIAVVVLLSPVAADAAGVETIEGEITGPGGTPIAEAWACAYLVQSEEFEESCDAAGSDGIYSISGLGAGKYKVEFWSESTEPSYVGEFYDDKPFWEEADEVDVEEGVVTTGINAELAEAATIEGQVNAPSLGGPVEYALVCAQLPTGEPVGCAPDRLDGSYTLPGLPPDEYKVQFIPASNLYNLLNQFYDHRSTFVEADPLAVTAGETRTGINADLEAGAEIHGTVYSAATGSPVSGVLVCALFMEEGEEGWWLRECVRTSGAGRYALFGLSTGSYKIVFSPELKEFFGEEVFEQEDDGYFKQYFDNKPTLAEADLLPLVVPGVRTGVNGHIQPEHPASLPSALQISPAIVLPRRHHRAARHCRAGFRKRKVGGKRRCVKRHKHRQQHRGHQTVRGPS